LCSDKVHINSASNFPLPGIYSDFGRLWVSFCGSQGGGGGGRQ